MKQMLLVFTICAFFGGTLFSLDTIFEDDHYIAIFDTRIMPGFSGATIIRLYKTNMKSSSVSGFSEIKGYSLRSILSLDRPSSPVPEAWCDNIHYGFSFLVDRFVDVLGFVSKQKSRLSPDQEDFVFSLPGEIIYFDRKGEPCSVECGAFQYTIDHLGYCADRCFFSFSSISDANVTSAITEFTIQLRARSERPLSENWCAVIRNLKRQYIKEDGQAPHSFVL